MFEWLTWFTHLENSKVFALVWFSLAFAAILLYVYSGKERRRRLESYKYIPLLDDTDEAVQQNQQKAVSHEHAEER